MDTTANDQLLDLDALSPLQKRVKLKGKVYLVNPPKMTDFIAFQRLFASMRDNAEDPVKQTESISKINQVLKPVVPDIEDMDLTFSQLMILMQFIYRDSLPADQDQVTQKKTT